jgi:hypothetical protein
MKLDLRIVNSYFISIALSQKFIPFGASLAISQNAYKASVAGFFPIKVAVARA